jgi:hypothetical protein
MSHEEAKKTEVKPETKSETKGFVIDTLIGLSKVAALAAAEAAGFKTRIVEEDGVAAMVDMQVNLKRVNLSVTKGNVAKVKIG